MYVTGDTIIRFATVLGALGTLGALLYRSFRWMEQQKAQQAEIENIKKEQCVICYGLLATLDGLKQLGANGNVSDAYQRLEKHLNQTAYLQFSSCISGQIKDGEQDSIPVAPSPLASIRTSIT